MEDLAQQQQITGKEIERIAENYKKDSQVRKTSEYLQNRLLKLEDQWRSFEIIDTEIRTDHADKLDHPYFSKYYYDQIKSGYEKTRDDINARLASIQTTKEKESPYDALPIGGGVKAPIPTPSSRVKGAIPKGTTKQPNHNMRGVISKYNSLTTILRKTLQGLVLDQDATPQYFQLKIDVIKKYWEAIQQLHQVIWDQLDEPVAEEYNAEDHFALEEIVQEKLICLYERLQSADQTSQTPTTARQSAVKLPKVVLPKFDGDYLQWNQFRDLFTELVHNQDIADCHKMWYLKTSLLGEAEKLIRHLTVSDANYTSAWEIINDRFENKRLLVTALINKLMSQACHTSESSTAIKTLHDTTRECLLGLQSLGIITTHWDPLLLHILLKKLERSTHTLWEQSLKEPRALPSIEDFLSFLTIRFQSLEALGTKPNPPENRKRYSAPRTLSSAVITSPACPNCTGDHKLFACSKFLQLTPAVRLHVTRKNKLCVNCLKPGHNNQKCQSRGCTKCSLKHNTLLHLEPSSPHKIATSTPNEGNTARSTMEPSNTNQLASLTARSRDSSTGYVLLSTVLVNLINKSGKWIECRAVLDSGSQLNFVTERIAKILRLKGIPKPSCIEGIGQQRHKTLGRATLTLHSKINGYNTNIEVHILPQIISAQPTQFIDTSQWAIPHNIALADPHFNQPQEIDLLIGAEIYYSILSIGQIKLKESLPTLQNTVFGWTFAGKVDNLFTNHPTCGICTDDEQLNEQIERFWRLEEVEGAKNTLTTAEKQCEVHFNQTCKRDTTGRFVVKLPMRENPQTLGESKDVAYRRFLALERKLNTNEQLRQQYCLFMDEYERLGHMKEVDFNKIQSPYYFLPHHAVVKPENSTTKVRVVFDGSAKTTEGISLNDILHIGPTIQEDLHTILLRFRLPRYVFTADIEKMYRQIKVDKHDQTLQLIWWRNRPDEKIKCFQLTTVTYGTACAPYLAIKSLQRLAEQDGEQYPVAARVIKQNVYVDDVLSGSNSLAESIAMQTQLQSLLQQGGFTLRKWCANHPQLLQRFPEDQKVAQIDFNDDREEHVKTVGLTWSPKKDDFRISYKHAEQNRITKRTIMSDIAHLFDPLGIMGPIVIVAKLFSQKLWALKVDWDASLPQEHHTYWISFKKGLRVLNDITFPRHVFSHRIPKCFQIHIFTDASERAFGAAAYIRSIDKTNVITVQLLCAKSRVAPLKQQTLPRLELCAAKLGAELANRVKLDLQLTKEAIYFWTDSEITLAWINSTSSTFQTFVANRVATIQRLTVPEQWRHVPSKQNAADVLSRGTTPEKLISDNLWFYGPPFLHGAESIWPPPYEKKGSCTREARIQPAATAAVLQEIDTHIVDSIDHRNSFKRLQRIVSYILRFVNNTRTQKQSPAPVLPAVELENARVVILRHMQGQEFREELNQLKRFGETAKNSSISSLTPFIDREGIIRVGGRLQASDLPYESRHPVLLPHSHPLTKVILTEVHLNHHHAGPQTTLAMARQRYWPLKGKTLVRSVVHNCVFCSRAKPRVLEQLMGSLPSRRVQPARPFLNSGVDFCGPVWTHFKTRGKRPQKAYIAVFCCFSTKAVHLELVSDLTTEGFIGALKRFTSRRGHCHHIHCDNGTNLVGAKNQLEEVREIINSKRAIDKITAACGSKGTNFHLIPPRAPHFGGLWEAAVKSAKHLLQSTLHAASMTYEEIETVLTEVEAILNSRPLTPMSDDPNDLMALTPGHFLVGEPLTSTVDAHAEPLRANLITRWKLVTHLRNDLWRRWHKEYLNQLQQRYKWKHRVQNLKPGTMVIIKEDNAPALQWTLGRVIKTYTGEDDLVRVADVRTPTGVFRRPIHKLAPLPIENSDEHNNNPSRTRSESPQTSVTSDKQPTANTMTPRPSTSHSQKRQSPSRDRDTSASKRRVKGSLGAALLSVLIAIMVLPITKATPVEIVPFSNTPGIYFENLGPSNTISSEWDLIVYYDTEPYWKEFQSIKGHVQKLQDICALMKEQAACNQIINQFQHSMNDLSELNEVLLKSSEETRARRGAVNFIGSMAHALFGILDSDYAEGMSNTIDKIEQNEVHLSELLKNHTSVLDATVNVIKRDEKAINEQFHQLEQHIDKITAKFNGIQQELYQENLSQLFTFISIQTTLLISTFSRIQGTIIDVMVDTHHGRISPQLIPPAQLLKEIVKVKQNIQPSLQLPASPDDILNFYNLVSIKGRLGQKRVIFKITIPLISSETLELLHIISVPVSVNDTFLAIQPTAPYLMINLHRDQYYPMTEHELSSCTSVNENRHLCKSRHPMYRKGSTVSACEITFMNQARQSSACRIVQVAKGPYWIQLHTGNQWIFSLDEKTTINVVCGTKVTQLSVEKSGLLKMQDDCVIKQQLLTIQGHKLISSSTGLSYIPSTNLTYNPMLNQVAPVLHQTRHYVSHLEELEDLKKKLSALHTELPAKLDKLRPHDVHQYAASYGGFSFLLMIIVSYFTCKHRRKICPPWKEQPNINQQIDIEMTTPPQGQQGMQQSEEEFIARFNT